MSNNVAGHVHGFRIFQLINGDLRLWFSNSQHTCITGEMVLTRICQAHRISHELHRNLAYKSLPIEINKSIFATAVADANSSKTYPSHNSFPANQPNRLCCPSRRTCSDRIGRLLADKMWCTSYCNNWPNIELEPCAENETIVVKWLIRFRKPAIYFSEYRENDDFNRIKRDHQNHLSPIESIANVQ